MSDAFSICLSTAAYPPQVGGVGVASQRLVRHLVSAGYVVHVVTSHDTPGASGKVERTDEDGAVVHRYHLDLAADPSAFLRFCEYFRRLDDEIGFSLFHGYFLTAVFPCLNVARRRPRRRPLIASIRGSDVSSLLDQPLSRSVILPGLKGASWITSVNHLYLDRVAEEVNIDGCASVIYNGVVPPRASQPWRLNEHNRGTVGCVAEFRRVKDVPLLIRGYAGVATELRRRLLLAGFFNDPEEEAWSRRLIDEFGIQEQVEITGRFAQEDVAHYLSAIHVYVQSSAYEGMPNALLEAASLGVPLVATDVGGMREVLEDGETALLVPHGEPRQLAAAIERVLGDDDLAMRLSEGSRRLAARLSPERERDEWLALYQRLLACS